jgi:hypothetical protein
VSLLAHAQALRAQAQATQHALEQCLATLHAAGPHAYFRYTLAPPTVTPAPCRRRGSRKAALLLPVVTAALQRSHDRQATIRQNALLTLVHLGVPVALWHFLFLTSLPLDPDALAPHGLPSA